jgi:protein DGCR14
MLKRLHICVNQQFYLLFPLQDVPKRDRLALELAEKNSKFYRDKKGKAISAARTHIKTPKSITMRASTLSPAAQRLATSKLGIRIGTDKALKAAYTPSPIHRKSSRSTPTPSSRSKDLINASVRSTGTPRTPKVLEGNNSAAESLTDNLLNLPSSRTPSSSGTKGRPKASDYM